MTTATNDLTELVQRVWGSFLGRCAQRFLAMAGIDRCLMLSSQAFTALIPLLILVATLAPAGQEDAITNVIIRRFALEGEAADAVTQLFEIPSGTTSGGLSLFSALLLVASGTSFTRRIQRMYRDAWGLQKAGVRSGMYAALGLVVLLAEVFVVYATRTLVAHLPLSWLLSVPISVVAGMALWTSIPYLLLDRRVHWRRLLVGGTVAGIGTAAYAVATTIYMPGVMERYTSEFGLFGISVALIGWLLAVASIIVVSAAVGAEFDASHASWVLAAKSRFGLEDPRLERPTPTVDDDAGLRAEDLLLLARVMVGWVVLAAAVWVATAVVPGIEVPGGPTTYLVISLVLGLLNALLSAVPHVVELPYAPFAVAASALVVNALLLGVTALLTDELEIDGIRSAVLGGLVISVVTTLFEAVRHPLRVRP